MKLAAIDIGTNSIHMIVVDVISRLHFEIIDREKEMVKLGAGVFSTRRLSDRAFRTGLETIRRYIHLADQLGVDEIITAATSAIREARNGESFLNEVVRQTGVSPRMISGQEEARLIFLAVRNSIALGNNNVLVFDIGGGSTEAIVGNQYKILHGSSMKLGVQRLLDMFEDDGPVGTEGRGVLEAHIHFLAQKTLDKVHQIGFNTVIGTSGTIRTLGEAAYLAANDEPLHSVNAEAVQLKDIEALTQRLLAMETEDRLKVEGISQNRVDAIHLGGVLLSKLLRLANVQEMTLCSASLREGLILDYLERHSQEVSRLPIRLSGQPDLRRRKIAQLISKYGSDWRQKSHVSELARQLFDQTIELHGYGDNERDLLEYSALLCDIGQYISFRRHHKHSRYLIREINPRGFTDEEILLMGHLVRYHRKAEPKKKHKKFKNLPPPHRHKVRVLSGILRIADGLDKTKNQWVEHVVCQISANTLTIFVSGLEDLELEIWAARRNRKVLAGALKRKILICEAVPLMGAGS